jgi:positive regulator of sigma E activity
MTEQGTVKKVEGPLVWICADQCVGCDHELHCGSCASGDGGSGNTRSESHHQLRIFGTSRERLFAVRNPQSLTVKTGDRVEYFIAPAKAIKAGFLILIVPILAFFLFYYLTGILWADATETAKVLFGVGGIAAGFAVNFALKDKTREYPEITKVLSPKP